VTDAETFTCILKCKICGAELDRFKNVPREHCEAAFLAAQTASQYSSRCEVESHNSHSDRNVNYSINWYKDTPQGLEFVETIEAPEIQLA
jgi:hypothetical protein